MYYDQAELSSVFTCVAIFCMLLLLIVNIPCNKFVGKMFAFICCILTRFYSAKFIDFEHWSFLVVSLISVHGLSVWLSQLEYFLMCSNYFKVKQKNYVPCWFLFGLRYWLWME